MEHVMRQTNVGAMQDTTTRTAVATLAVAYHTTIVQYVLVMEHV